MTIIIASNNNGKIYELTEMIKRSNLEYDTIKTLRDVCGDIDIPEDGNSYEENALIKATYVRNQLLNQNKLQEKDIIISDDSGFEIDYLNGAPGLYAARFIGYDVGYSVKNKAILDLMRLVPTHLRVCHYISHIVVLDASGNQLSFSGKLTGKLSDSIHQPDGFDFDGIFEISSEGKTLSDLSIDEKLKISHRAMAFSQAITYLESIQLCRKVC